MVKICAWGTCNSDTRYPDRVKDVTFVPFPKPKTNFDKCLRWVRACGRPHNQLNPQKITRHTYVCSKVKTFLFLIYSDKIIFCGGSYKYCKLCFQEGEVFDKQRFDPPPPIFKTMTSGYSSDFATILGKEGVSIFLLNVHVYPPNRKSAEKRKGGGSFSSGVSLLWKKKTFLQFFFKFSFVILLFTALFGRQWTLKRVSRSPTCRWVRRQENQNTLEKKTIRDCMSVRKSCTLFILTTFK
jgi:hypothetical protein